MSFFVELWESIFTPGTTPALIKATHGSFILLLLSLLFLIYYTRSIHFINLFVLAALLYALVMWFVAELQRVKLMDNQELQKESQEQEHSKSVEADVSKPVSSASGSSNKGAKSAPKKRKA